MARPATTPRPRKIADILTTYGIDATVPPVNSGLADRRDYTDTVITAWNGAEDNDSTTLSVLAKLFKRDGRDRHRSQPGRGHHRRRRHEHPAPPRSKPHATAEDRRRRRDSVGWHRVSGCREAIDTDVRVSLGARSWLPRPRRVRRPSRVRRPRRVRRPCRVRRPLTSRRRSSVASPARSTTAPPGSPRGAGGTPRWQPGPDHRHRRLPAERHDAAARAAGRASVHLLWPESTPCSRPAEPGRAVRPPTTCHGTRSRALLAETRVPGDVRGRVLPRVAERRGKPRWAEKTPLNIAHLGWVLSHFPRARVIHVIRDGRDVVCSLRHHPVRRFIDGGWKSAPQDRSVVSCTRQWLSLTGKGMAWRTDAAATSRSATRTWSRTPKPRCAG